MDKGFQNPLDLSMGRLRKKLEKHDIGLLLDKLSAYKTEVGDLEARAESLTDFATMYRYPNSEAEPLTQEIVAKAIGDAEIFLSKARHLIAVAKNDGGDGAGGDASGGPPQKNRGISGPK